MYSKSSFLLAALSAAAPALAHYKEYKLNTYWGQNGVGDTLAEYCASESIDYVTLGFVNLSPENGNGSDLPGTNFAAHCAAGVYWNKGKESQLLKDCDFIRNDIKTCQALGKKVLLSIGGEYSATNDYSISTVEKGTEFADFMFDAFGPYDPTYDGPRPFDISDNDHISLDGFDFDIEYNFPDQRPYVTMVNRLRQRIEASSRKDIILTAAPQCPLDAQWFQMKTIIHDAKFDKIWVQFYNNQGCDASSDLTFNFNAWALMLAATRSSGAELFIGLPASEQAAGSGYISRERARDVICKAKKSDKFGGVMLWDAYFAANNVENGKAYYDSIADALKCGCAGETCAQPTTTSSTVPPSSSVTTSSSTSSTSTSTSPSATSSSIISSSTTSSFITSSSITSSSITSSSITSSSITSSSITSSSATLSSITTSSSQTLKTSTGSISRTISWSNSTITTSSASRTTSSTVSITLSSTSSTIDETDCESSTSGPSATSTSSGLISSSASHTTTVPTITPSTTTSTPPDTTSYTKSTVMTTVIYTVTSCAPSVTDCPGKGSVTTETIPLYTTICPVTETSGGPPTTVSTEVPLTTSTIYSTRTATVTKCPPTVTDCPVGSVTTEVVAISTTVCPVTEAESKTKIVVPTPVPTTDYEVETPAPTTEYHAETIATSYPVHTPPTGSPRISSTGITPPLYPTGMTNSTVPSVIGTGSMTVVPVPVPTTTGGGGSASDIPAPTCSGASCPLPTPPLTAGAAKNAGFSLGGLLLIAALAL